MNIRKDLAYLPDAPTDKLKVSIIDLMGAIRGWKIAFPREKVEVASFNHIKTANGKCSSE